MSTEGCRDPSPAAKYRPSGEISKQDNGLQFIFRYLMFVSARKGAEPVVEAGEKLSLTVILRTVKHNNAPSRIRKIACGRIDRHAVFAMYRISDHTLQDHFERFWLLVS